MVYPGQLTELTWVNSWAAGPLKGAASGYISQGPGCHGRAWPTSGVDMDQLLGGSSTHRSH